ncbi:MAG: ATP-binding protein [Bacteroidetes bacterium]|nr:ATP-binding protein [Bacteroidota bacterium]
MQFPIIGITGPRQSGKTTMIRKTLGNSFKYVTFDDYRMIDFFTADPISFIHQYDRQVIFDEVQKVPELFNHLKIAVDENREETGRFVITGSSQFSFVKGITESLAGRIGLLSLLPFQFSEIPQGLRAEAVYSGSYPEVVRTGYQNAHDWYSSYLETFVLRDVKSLVNIGDLRDFRQFLTMLAARTSQLLNYSELSRSIGVSVSTIRRWISVLEAAYIIFLLPPWYRNLGKRIIKSPKVYFYDTGLVCLLTGVTTKELYHKGPMAGSIFENYIVAEIIKNLVHSHSSDQMFFYRTSHGEEIDLIIDRISGKQVIEIKKTATFRTQMVRNIEKILGPEDMGFLIYEGNNFPYNSNIQIMQYAQYLTE